jgi:GNAT superfamily N-acetyltransferase
MEGLSITLIQPIDLAWVTGLFAQEVYADEEAASTHFAGHVTGEADTFLAHVSGRFAGYVTIRWQSNNPHLRAAGIPLIHHLEVFPPFQRRGIASRLMDAAEQHIARRARAVGITVGLFDAYGPAQRLYAKRGYVPDGRGACQGLRPLTHGETATMDHDLIIWLTKDLAPVSAQ